METVDFSLGYNRRNIYSFKEQADLVRKYGLSDLEDKSVKIVDENSNSKIIPSLMSQVIESKDTIDNDKSRSVDAGNMKPKVVEKPIPKVIESKENINVSNEKINESNEKINESSEKIIELKDDKNNLDLLDSEIEAAQFKRSPLTTVIEEHHEEKQGWFLY